MKKLFRNTIAILLAVIFACQASVTAFAASSKREYISDVVLSYAQNAAEANSWLTENGYTPLDNNLNEGATSSFQGINSYVYLGYKTTTDASKAITDMKLMNMDGGYSLEDYQMLLNEQKLEINAFMDGFIDVLKEYRTNYSKGDKRALSAYKYLNMFKDDDTGLTFGDLLLNRIKEEYTDAKWNAMSDDEKKNHADMTTILMQGNAQSVLAVEQSLAMATDISDTLWLERCDDAKCYDDMLDELVEKYGDVNKATSELAEKYDDVARTIADMVEPYTEWIDDYANCGVTVNDDADTINNYISTLTDDSTGLIWYSKGAQYEALKNIELSDGTTLLDLMTLDDAEDNIEQFYPIVAALTAGQQYSVSFLNGNQFVSMGYNTDEAVSEVATGEGVGDKDEAVSIYDGIDRSVFGTDVALTGDAYELETSSDDKEFSNKWFSEGVSSTTKYIMIAAGASLLASVGSFLLSTHLNPADVGTRAANNYVNFFKNFKGHKDLENVEMEISDMQEGFKYRNLYEDTEVEGTISSNFYWSKIFKAVGIVMTISFVILSMYSLFRTYEEVCDYYSVEYTSIPGWMVDEGTDENGKTTFTYYKNVKCNNAYNNSEFEQLGTSGDINGDAGRQWVALYTTTDTSAGDPILADSFTVQYGDNSIPDDSTPLSMFDEKVAQNLTNKKAGYTFNDKKGGIYLFYKTYNPNTFTASSISTIGWVGIGIGGVAVIAGIAFIITKAKKKKATKQN